MTNLFVNSPAVSEGRQAQADGKQKDAKEPKKEKPNKAAAEHVLTLQTRKRNNMWGEPQDCSYFFNVLWLWICLSFSFLMFLSCSCFFRIIFPCPFKDLNLVLAVSDIFSHIFPHVGGDQGQRENCEAQIRSIPSIRSPRERGLLRVAQKNGGNWGLSCWMVLI